MSKDHIKYHYNIDQNSELWYELRCGVITASRMKDVLTPETLLPSKGRKKGTENSYFYELLAQRIYDYVPSTYQSYDMKMGSMFEEVARELYSAHFEPVKECGFITNDKYGFMLGYSPDGLVGEKKLIEIKRKIEKLQVQVLTANAMPVEHSLQLQTGLLVTERECSDFISYKDGMHMLVKEVEPDTEVQDKILEHSRSFDNRLNEAKEQFNNMIESDDIRVIPTDRILTEQDVIGELK